MKRISIAPRSNWVKAVEDLGFGFHSTHLPYWDESAAYVFTLDEILYIEESTLELWDMCLAAVQHVMDNKLYDRFCIPEWIVPYLENTWVQDHPSIYGRFDLAYNNGQLKLLEFNADTPSALFEAGIIQWYWLQDHDQAKDQFNSIHEKLVDYWRYLKTYLYREPLYFTCLKETLEDLTTTEYLRDCAMQAGLETRLIFIEDIGWDTEAKCFTDNQDLPIKNIFKLYPWEWLLKDEFGKNITEDANRAFWIEPAWKMILSNKAILPILWELFPHHPLLLKASFSPDGMDSYVQKPIFAREGANVSIYKNGSLLEESTGTYGEEGYIYQEYFPLFETEGKSAILGSWVIGQEAAGMGVRESDGPITDISGRFVPHYIEG